MRAKRSIGAAVVVVVMGCFSFSAVYAQDYTLWEGAWFQINIGSKGYERNIGGTPDWMPLNDKTTAFLRIGTWVDPNGSIAGDETYASDMHFYEDDFATWEIMPMTLHRIHGNPLDMFIWSQTDDGDIATGTGQRIAFVARITGKMDNTGASLQTGNFRSLGGFIVEMDASDPFGALYEPGGLTITGKLIIPETFCRSSKNQSYPPCQR